MLSQFNCCTMKIHQAISIEARAEVTAAEGDGDRDSASAECLQNQLIPLARHFT